MNKSLVTVICLCYNHGDYVLESLKSVIDQTHKNIQLIIVDDASTDSSVSIIDRFLNAHSDIQFIKQNQNIGNCRAFNAALKYAKGDYIIDLAADDILLPERITDGINTFDRSGDDYGINFTDAAYIDRSGKVLKNHYKRDNSGNVIVHIPQDEVFKEILKTHFICSPTTMMKKIVFNELGGYDELLAYEDFDLWVRASRCWKFCYTDGVLVHKRVLAPSHGKQQYKRGNSQMASTYRICEKAYDLCQSKDEYAALRKRILYELKHALWLVKPVLIAGYSSLWIKSIR